MRGGQSSRIADEMIARSEAPPRQQCRLAPLQRPLTQRMERPLLLLLLPCLLPTRLLVRAGSGVEVRLLVEQRLARVSPWPSASSSPRPCRHLDLVVILGLVVVSAWSSASLRPRSSAGRMSAFTVVGCASSHVVFKLGGLSAAGTRQQRQRCPGSRLQWHALGLRDEGGLFDSQARSM